MARRVICECPHCHVETIVNKADVVADPLFVCPECGATMIVDLEPPADALVKRESDSIAETQASPDLGSFEGGEREPEPMQEVSAEPAPRPPKSTRPLIAKTMPMLAPSLATPAAKATRGDTRRAQPAGISPVVLVVVGVVGAGVGWFARGQQAAAHDGTREMVEVYCEGGADGQTAAQMCEHLLGRAP